MIDDTVNVKMPSEAKQPPDLETIEKLANAYQHAVEFASGLPPALTAHLAASAKVFSDMAKAIKKGHFERSRDTTDG